MSWVAFKNFKGKGIFFELEIFKLLSNFSSTEATWNDNISGKIQFMWTWFKVAEDSININRPLKSVLFICKNLVSTFSLQFACNKHVMMLTS